jgi:hypothetical protein
LTAVGRVLRRRKALIPDRRSARSALVAAAVGDLPEDDELMPLLLAAAIEAARADAAVVTFVRDGDRRRSYSANLNVREARSAIEDVEAPEPRLGRRVIPIERPDVRGALGVYWRAEEPREIATGDLEELVASAFRHAPRPAEADEHARWSRLAEFNGTLEPAVLLRKIVNAALVDCGANAAAARLEAGTEVTGFADHEEDWVGSVLASHPLAPSITRYLETGEDSIATAIVVPLQDGDGETIGNLVAVWRRDLADDADRKVAELEVLVEDARSAIGHAVQFQQLHSLAVRDPSAAVKPATTAVVTGPMRLSFGEGAEDWTLHTRVPGKGPGM